MPQAGDTVAIRLRYGDAQQQLELPADRLLDEVRMRDTPGARHPAAVVASALDAPIGGEPLDRLAAGARSVVIVCDDMTRPTPAALLVPEVLARLAAAGVRDEAITFLIATGTHRPMSRAELEGKLGADAVARCRVVNHDHRDADGLVDLGSTPSGVPIAVNRLVAGAELVIGLGNIVPHRYCGWAGGSKIIQPGVSGEPTTAATHLMITKDPDARLGVVENRVRREIEAVAERVGLRFIVNTILNSQAEIVDVVAGEPRAAFREGVRRAREIYTAALSGRADVVVCSAYPSDLNLWQAGKALYAADLCVGDGGIIVLASPCYEGVGEHGAFAELVTDDYETIEAQLAAGTVDDRIGAAAALAVALVRARAAIWIVSSHIDDATAARMRFRRFDAVQAAVDEALEHTGPGARVTVVHEATELLPVLPEPA